MHTRARPSARTLSRRPHCGARPSHTTSKRRGINSATSSSGRRYSKLFTPAEYHFMRARVCEMVVRRIDAVILLSARNNTTRTHRQTLSTPRGPTKLPAPATTRVLLLFLGDFLFQRLDDIFQSRESSSFRRHLRYNLVFALDSKIILLFFFFFFCHVSSKSIIIIIFLVPSHDDGREREFDRVGDFDVLVEIFRFWVVQDVHVERFGRVEAVASRERAFGE